MNYIVEVSIQVTGTNIGGTKTLCIPGWHEEQVLNMVMGDIAKYAKKEGVGDIDIKIEIHAVSPSPYLYPHFETADSREMADYI